MVRAITFSKYIAQTAELFINLDILPFKQIVFHRIGILMFKNYIRYVQNVMHNPFTTNTSIHDYTNVTGINCVLLMANTDICTKIFASYVLKFGITSSII